MVRLNSSTLIRVFKYTVVRFERRRDCGFNAFRSAIKLIHVHQFLFLREVNKPKFLICGSRVKSGV